MLERVSTFIEKLVSVRILRYIYREWSESRRTSSLSSITTWMRMYSRKRLLLVTLT